jgi:glycosyltransferase involved in cell wall biosynthesis
MVTIAIPAYKATYLEAAIQSAINQTYRDIEVVVVNDKSPNDITSIVKSFDDERIRYFINEENIGGKDLVAQWNKCLSYARGEFFCLLCDDDLYTPSFVEEMIALSEKHPLADVFRGRVKMISGDGKLADIFTSSPEYEATYDYMWQKWKGTRRQTVSEFMIRTSRARAVGGYYSLPRGWGSDSLSVFLFSMANGIVSTNKILVSFRQSGQNISSSSRDDAEQKICAAELYREKCRELISGCEDENLRAMLEKYEATDFDTRVLYILNDCSLPAFVRIVRRHHLSKRLALKGFLAIALRRNQ